MKLVVNKYTCMAGVLVLITLVNTGLAATKTFYVTDAIGVSKYWYDTSTHEVMKDSGFAIHDEDGSDFDQPTGAAVGPDDLLYVAGQDSGTIVRFNRVTGERVDVLATLPGCEPAYITFGPDKSGDGIEDLYVATWTNNIARIPTAGADEGTVYNFTSGGSITNTTDVAFGPDGNLYVVGVGMKVVEKYDGATGAFISTFATQTQNTMGLGFNDDGSVLYTTNYANTPNGGVTKIDGVTGTIIADPFVTGYLYCTSITIGPDYNDNGTRDIYTGHPVPGTYLDGNRVEVFDGLTGEDIGPIIDIGDQLRPKKVVWADPVAFTPGDANRDGIVDEDDATILADHWLSTGKYWFDGDFNDDHVVNEIDATLLAANWQTGAATTLTIPEPSSAALLLAAMVGISTFIRRRK